MTVIIDTADPRVVAPLDAIHKGDTAALRSLLSDHPGLATAGFGTDGQGGMTRTALHVVTDWPGHYSNGPETVAVLVDAGADVNARFTGPHTETPLHWAASSDDVPVLNALLDHGADTEAYGAVIGGGTALDDAVAFAQWNTARRLVERGVQVSLFNAAALGQLDRVRDHITAQKLEADLASAFWGGSVTPVLAGGLGDGATHAPSRVRAAARCPGCLHELVRLVVAMGSATGCVSARTWTSSSPVSRSSRPPWPADLNRYALPAVRRLQTRVALNPTLRPMRVTTKPARHGTATPLTEPNATALQAMCAVAGGEDELRPAQRRAGRGLVVELVASPLANVLQLRPDVVEAGKYLEQRAKHVVPVVRVAASTGRVVALDVLDYAQAVPHVVQVVEQRFQACILFLGRAQGQCDDSSAVVPKHRFEFHDPPQMCRPAGQEAHTKAWLRIMSTP